MSQICQTLHQYPLTFVSRTFWKPSPAYTMPAQWTMKKIMVGWTNLFSNLTTLNSFLADEITYLWVFTVVEMFGVLLIPVLWRGLKTKSFRLVACWLIFEVTSLTFQLFFCWIIMDCFKKLDGNHPGGFFKSFIKIIVVFSFIVEIAMFVLVIYIVKNFEYFGSNDHQPEPSRIAVIVLPDAPPAYNESFNAPGQQDQQSRYGEMTNFGFVIWTSSVSVLNLFRVLTMPA